MKYKMKYFRFENTENGYGKKGFVFKNIFSICIEDDNVIFTEECEGYRKEKITKQQAIELFEEAIGILKGVLKNAN